MTLSAVFQSISFPFVVATLANGWHLNIPLYLNGYGSMETWHKAPRVAD